MRKKCGIKKKLKVKWLFLQNCSLSLSLSKKPIKITYSIYYVLFRLSCLLSHIILRPIHPFRILFLCYFQIYWQKNKKYQYMLLLFYFLLFLQLILLLKIIQTYVLFSIYFLFNKFFDDDSQWVSRYLLKTLVYSRMTIIIVYMP